MSASVRAPLSNPRRVQAFWRRSLARLRETVGQGRHRAFGYEDPETPQSLREGLSEYYASDPTLLAPSNVPGEIAIELRAHDASHVVFGCDTSVRGEVVLARWSLLGAEGAFRIYLRGLRSKETRFLFADFFRKVRPLMLLAATFDGARAIIRSFSMRRRWPTLDWERHADRPLAEIRREFGIRVV